MRRRAAAAWDNQEGGALRHFRGRKEERGGQMGRGGWRKDAGSKTEAPLSSKAGGRGGRGGEEEQGGGREGRKKRLRLQKANV